MTHLDISKYVVGAIAEEIAEAAYKIWMAGDNFARLHAAYVPSTDAERGKGIVLAEGETLPQGVEFVRQECLSPACTKDQIRLQMIRALGRCNVLPPSDEALLACGKEFEKAY